MATTNPAISVQDNTTFITILAVVLATVVLVVAGAVVVSITAGAVCQRKRRNRRNITIGKGESGNRDTKCNGSNIIGATSVKTTDKNIYYEPVEVEKDVHHYDTPLCLPFPLPLPPPNPKPISNVVIRSDSNAYVVMQPCPAYNAAEDTPPLAGDTPTSAGDYTYVQVAQPKL